MGKLIFSTTPQKRFYSYKSDGCIYNITTVVPTVVCDGGGYWSCYFMCEPYYKDTNKQTHLLYVKTQNDGGETVYVATNAQSFNYGGEFWYMAEDKNTNSWTKFTGTKYWNRSGQISYDMPKSSKELPLIVDDNTTYYLDTFIHSGDTYDKSGKKFIPMDINGKDGATTYGELVLEKVKDNITIQNFENNVLSNIPKYLKSNVASIGYVAPDFTLFGEMFMEKLNAVMVEAGENIIKRYNTTDGSTVKVTGKVEAKKGIITSEKVTT